MAKSKGNKPAPKSKQAAPTYTPTEQQLPLVAALRKSTAQLNKVALGLEKAADSTQWQDTVRAFLGGLPVTFIKAECMGYENLCTTARATVRKSLSICENCAQYGVQLVVDGAIIGRTAAEEAYKATDAYKADKAKDPADEGDGKPGSGKVDGPASERETAMEGLGLLLADSTLRADPAVSALFAKVAEAYSKDRAEAAAGRVRTPRKPQAERMEDKTEEIRKLIEAGAAQQPAQTQEAAA